jgi:hypothetical protein
MCIKQRICVFGLSPSDVASMELRFTVLITIILLSALMNE